MASNSEQYKYKNEKNVFVESLKEGHIPVPGLHVGAELLPTRQSGWTNCAIEGQSEVSSFYVLCHILPEFLGVSAIQATPEFVATWIALDHHFGTHQLVKIFKKERVICLKSLFR